MFFIKLVIAAVLFFWIAFAIWDMTLLTPVIDGRVWVTNSDWPNWLRE